MHLGHKAAYGSTDFAGAFLEEGADNTAYAPPVMSKAQMEAFCKIYFGNARPVQPLIDCTLIEDNTLYVEVGKSAVCDAAVVMRNTRCGRQNPHQSRNTSPPEQRNLAKVRSRSMRVNLG